jgi:hypothetical protein
VPQFIPKLSVSERGVHAASLSLLPHLSLNSNLVGSFCPSILDGSNFILRSAVAPAMGYVLLTSTNVATPLASWTPILTNQFNSFGALTLTNLLDRNEPHRFFILRTP